MHFVNGTIDPAILDFLGPNDLDFGGASANNGDTLEDFEYFWGGVDSRSFYGCRYCRSANLAQGPPQLGSSLGFFWFSDHFSLSDLY